MLQSESLGLSGCQLERNIMTNLFISFPSDSTENGQDTRPINTEDEMAAARAALRDLGLTEADVYVGGETDPDSHANGQAFFA
jgi:hypothetical protein